MSKLILDNFAPSRFLYDDIINNNMIYQFSNYINKLVDFTFEGSTGMNKIESIMSSLRNNNIEKIDDLYIEDIIDYNEKQINNPQKIENTP